VDGEYRESGDQAAFVGFDEIDALHLTIADFGLENQRAVRAIVELGGTYPDVVQALQQAKSCHALSGRFEVDALPDNDRSYRPHSELADEPAGAAKKADERIVVANPLPDLFSTKKRKFLR